jgi:hypothetical protein
MRNIQVDIGLALVPIALKIIEFCSKSIVGELKHYT